MRKEILIGFVVAIIATLIGFFIYVQFFSDFGISDSLKVVIERRLYGKVLGFSAIPNLLVFFVFLKKRQDYRARGVLMATILIALTMLIFKFI